jgi:hypothetical protein
LDLVPCVVAWYEIDHVEGVLSLDLDECLVAYFYELDSTYPKVLYSPSPYLSIIDQEGDLNDEEWCEVATWASIAKCTGEAPSARQSEETDIAEKISPTAEDCDPAASNPDVCATSDDIFGFTDLDRVPCVVVWYEIDHVEGVLSLDFDECLDAYYRELDSTYPKILYSSTMDIMAQEGALDDEQSCELKTWAYWAQCNGEAPSAQAEEIVIAEKI